MTNSQYAPETIPNSPRIAQSIHSRSPLLIQKNTASAAGTMGPARKQISQVAALRTQQRVVLSLLELSSKQPLGRTLSKETWTQMFRAIGMSDEEMRQWHANFEKNMPDAHADFLHSLGLGAEEIRRIRAWSAG